MSDPKPSIFTQVAEEQLRNSYWQKLVGQTNDVAAVDSDGAPCVWRNWYSCRECTSEQIDWTSDWSCKCNDECPKCGAETEPVKSDWLGDGEAPAETPMMEVFDLTAEQNENFDRIHAENEAARKPLAPEAFAALHEDATGHEDEIVYRCAPRWAWEIMDETLAMDAHSSAFSSVLRAAIRDATMAMIVSCENGDRTVRKWESGERSPNPIACQVLRWMLAGFKPPNMGANTSDS